MVLWDLFAKQDYHALHHYLFFYSFHLAETKESTNVLIINKRPEGLLGSTRVIKKTFGTVHH